jgi:hypothetical protein
VQRRGEHTSTTIELLLGKHVLVAGVTHASGGKRDVVYEVRALQKRRELGRPVQLSSAREAEKKISRLVGKCFL